MAAGQTSVRAQNGKAITPSSRRRRKAPRCEDCFFRRNGLCALGLDEPCPTFRPDTPRGLVPPAQPELLARDPIAHAA